MTDEEKKLLEDAEHLIDFAPDDLMGCGCCMNDGVDEWEKKAKEWMTRWRGVLKELA